MICGKAIAVAALMIGTYGCRPGEQDAHTVIALSGAIGIREPFVQAGRASADRQTAFAALLSALDGRGAQVLAADPDAGFVSWCDAGIAFVPVPARLRKRPAKTSAGGMAFWQGVVYGAARLRDCRGGTRLHLHAAGRELGGVKPVFSDGSYERELLREFRDAVRVARGSKASTGAPGVRIRPRARPEQAGVTYERLFFSQFRNLPPLAAQEIRRTGTSKLFPVPVDQFWAGCLDVVFQSDSVPLVSPKDRIIVFAQGTAIPSNDPEKKFRHADVIMALHAARRGRLGTTVYVAYLSPRGLAVSRLPDLSKVPAAQVGSKFRNSPHKLAAAMVADRLFGRLATQLFHRDRWRDKLTRRIAKELRVQGTGIPSPVTRRR